MNRVVLIIVAVVALLFGIGRVVTGLVMLASVHASGLAGGVFVLFYLGVGAGAIIAGALILRGQLRDGAGGTGGDVAGEAASEAARRDVRRGLKIVGIIGALLLGIAGLLLSLCGGIVMQGDFGGGGGGLLAVGLLVLAIAIALLVWAIRR